MHFDGKHVGPGIIKNYPRNLSAMFRDLRKDLDAPDMPIVIGEMGVGGHEIAERAKEPGEGEGEGEAVQGCRLNDVYRAENAT